MQEFMALNRNLKLRTLTVFLTVLLGSSIGPNMTIYYVQYFGAFISGILLMVVSVAGFIAGLYGGHLSDVWGRKRTMLTGSALIIIGYGLAMLMNAPWYTNPYITFIGFLLASVGSSFADPAEQAMMIDASTVENRKFVYALIYWVLNIGVMIGAAIGGWFFRDYLFELLLGSVVVGLVNAFIIKLGMAETLDMTHVQANSSVWSAVKSYGQVLSDKRYVLFMFGSIFSVVIYSQPDFYLAAHLTKSFHDYTFMGIHFYGQRMLSFMLVINTILIILVMNYINHYTNRWALRRSFALGTFMQGFGFAISFLLHDFWPLIIVTFVFTLGEIINVPSSQTMRADMMNPLKIGAYSGAFAATRPVGNILAGSMVSLSQFTNDWGMAGALMVGTFIAIVTIAKASKMPAPFESKG
ncbi:MFS transporter, DHA1 family, multidrug resistance protein B [Weissella bombi]|uniref:MFS transporter, DHA1 family, multidrug resistance protein B n=1 Tax=Weissella bombi TaxID=1505725 RepID=A0A1C3ZSY0_9LACO|nr:MFS transporter [Weissella bombi]SCB85547.1 MFS transporter, DHA1 family, multidrug resistance protein B [Weissella bombi]